MTSVSFLHRDNRYPHPHFGNTSPKDIAKALQGLKGSEKGDFHKVAARLEPLGFEPKRFGLLLHPDTGETVHVDAPHGDKTSHVTLQDPEGKKVKDIHYFA